MAEDLQTISRPSLSVTVPTTRPRIAFLGVGSIGLQRLETFVREAVVREDVADVVGLCDPSESATDAAGDCIDAEVVSSLDELLELEPDGVVIATPTAQHAVQAQQALLGGTAVFCQYPLGRNRRETERVIAAAREADRLLGVDAPLRHLDGALAMRRLIRSGALGEIYAVDLTCHGDRSRNREWWFDPRRSGGGCVMDLGIQLIDLATWMTGEWGFEDVRSTLWHRGQMIGTPVEVVEDAAVADWRQPEGAVVRLACSWQRTAGQKSFLEAKFFGTQGTVAVRNVGGSLLDFVCEYHRETDDLWPDESFPAAGLPCEPCGEVTCDDRNAASLVRWARQLAEGCRFDSEIEQVSAVAGLVEEIYRHPRRD